MLMDVLNATEDSSPCNSTPMNLLNVRCNVLSKGNKCTGKCCSSIDYSLGSP